MADLEDAEDAIAQQEAWGQTLTDVAVKRLAKAARAIRNVLSNHTTRLAAIEARLDALEAEPVPSEPVPSEPVP